MRTRLPPVCGRSSHRSQAATILGVVGGGIFTDLLSWPDAKGNMRVVRSQESWTAKPQLILLLAFLACNIFQAFFALNLKPEVRCGRTVEFWVRLIAAEISRPPALLPTGRATLTYASVRHTRMLLKGFL